MMDIISKHLIINQISKLTPADEETITEILEIPPGRIDNDNWVNQAREFAKKQTSGIE